MSAEGLPSLGIAATLDIGHFDSSLAVFFDSAEPQKSLMAGAVSNLTLQDVVKSFLAGDIRSPIDDALSKISIHGTHRFDVPGTLGANLDNLKLDEVSQAFQSKGGIKIPADVSQLHLVTIEKGRRWNLTDLTTLRHYQLEKKGDAITVSIEAQFYFAPEQTMIGAARFPTGFYINAALDIFGFRATSTVSIDANRGISIDAELSKITIGGESLFSLMAAQGSGGVRVSVSSFSQPSAQDPQLRSPHFYLNGALCLLGIKESVYASVSSAGVQFSLQGNLAPRVHFELSGKFSGAQDLGVSGSASVGIGSVDLGVLGKVKLDTDVAASLSVGVQGPKVFAEAKASFKALGQGYQIGSFQLSTQASSLADFAKTIEQKVASIFTDLFKDVNQWANAVQKGCIEGVDDVGAVLTDVYSVPAKEAEKMVKSMGKQSAKLAKELGNVAVDTGNSIAKGAESTGKSVEKGVESAGKSVGHAIGGLFHKKHKH